MLKKKRKAFIAAAIILALVFAAILYALADRYLIAHVQIADVKAATAVSPAHSSSALVQVANVNTDSTVSPSTPSPAPVTGEWTYETGSVSILITKISTGSGNNSITYFMADVVVKDATVLQSAFANNQFGTNIIETTSAIAGENNAIFAINGDYYGFRTDGIIIRNGVIFRDEPARTGLAFYLDGSMKIYDEIATSGQSLLDEGVWNTLSFGPAIIENSEVPDGIEQVEVDTNIGNHSIQGSQPRTGVGIMDENHFVFIVADGRSPGYSKGVTMTEFAGIFKDLGCTTAYNIDGGGSSTMYFNGRVVNNPLGKNRERGTSDILYISKEV